MFVNQLFEDFESDYSVHTRAKSIMNDILQEIKELKLTEKNYVNSPVNNSPAILISKFKDNPDIGNVYILVGSRKTKASGEFYANDPTRMSIIQLNIFDDLSKMTPTNFGNVENRIKDIPGSPSNLNTLYHEIIHAIQHKNGWLKKSVKRQSNLGLKDYYNSSAEFDAYFHNIVEHYMSLITTLKNNPSDIDDYVDIYEIDEDFNVMLKRILRYIDAPYRQFIRNLTNKRHKRLISRIYNLHKKLIEVIKNKPLQEDFSSDHRTASIATDITNKIRNTLKQIKFKHLSNEKYWTYVNIGDNIDRPCFATDLKLGGDYKDVNLCLFIKDEGIHGVYFRDDNFKGIGLFVLPEQIPPSFDVSYLADDKKWMSSVYHEVIHAIQDAQNKVVDSSTVDYSKSDYYNDPSEFDAFFHQISDVMFKTYKELENDYQSGIKMMKDNGIVPNFTNTMVNILTDANNPDIKSIQEFIHHLKDKRYKRILKRFYNIHNQLIREADNGAINDQ